MSAHITSRSVYFRVFVALLLLTGLTTAIAFVDLGPLNNVLAIGIAIAKMLLVALFFMHIRHESSLTWAFVVVGILFFLILLSLTLGDYASRAWQYVPAGWT